MAAISHVFTIDYVAKMLGEDVEWLHELQIGMEPEDGCLWVHGVGEDGVPAFTGYGIEYLKETIADERMAGSIRCRSDYRNSAVVILTRCSPLRVSKTDLFQ